ncbi:MAG: hypothetical protein EAZ27_09035 [Cytophagales bacterium]|nr:MAG: hypothetical protein EAZ27_09035 [Cytophagales bacterium]
MITIKKQIKYFFLVLIFFFTTSIFAQEVIWADKIIDYTDRFQLENNFSEYALGLPSIYPSSNLDDPHDPYSEGYLVHFENTKKENIFQVGFPKPLNARQILIGGIFNKGTIKEIYAILKDNAQKLVYTNSELPTLKKFKSFSTFMPLNTVYGLKIVLDHSKINDWNLIKGIGITNDEKQYKIEPNFIEDTTHKHKKEIVGENINSKDCFEFSPKISPDGKSMYFVKECENQIDQDIWYSSKDSLTGKWTEAKNVGMPLNNKGHNFVASISPDGQTLIVGNRYNPDGTEAGDGVSIAHKNINGEWSNPVPIDIPNYKNKNDHSNFFLSSSNDVLLVATQDDNSVGDLDLYVSLFNKRDKTWSELINLGKRINTTSSEDYPYLAVDGKTLYFSSKGQIGYGGHDIYVSTRLDNSWQNWSKPQNLGPFVNTKADDKGFSIASEGDHAYFNSAGFNSDLHHMDIYRIDLPKILHQTPRVLLSGVCMDSKSKSPLRSVITIKDENDEPVAFCSTNPKTGSYLMSVPHGKKYSIQSEAIEYFKYKEVLDFSGKFEKIESVMNVEMTAFIDTGMVMKIENIQFGFSVATILEESYESLNKVADMMKQQSRSVFEIDGHTDNVASAESNQKLSEDRAAAVVAYLTQRGISQNRFKKKGYGESMPIASNETEAGRALNRRVEFKVLEKYAFEAEKKKMPKITRFSSNKKKK